MSILEISLLIAALLPVLYRGLSGWRFGVATEIRHLLVTLFAVFVAIRYWQPWVETISGGLTFDPRWIATASFLVLYGLGAAVAGFVVRLTAQKFLSVKADPVSRLLGLAAGVFSGALLGGCLLWLSTVALPGEFKDNATAQALSAWPRNVFQAAEIHVARVDPASPSLTRYPTVTLAQVPVDAPPGALPEGSVLMRIRGQIAWR